ncbi:MAG: FHA domain-containing protein [Rhodobacterales bacterium]|nr:FHA domain-containing protein [Rhodobacterales bacterium]
MAEIPVLVCVAGALAGKRIIIPDGGLELGRSEDNLVVIVDDGVSRFHARLLFDNGSLWLQDSGSRNGVYVNEERVTQHRALKVGDKLRIAKHVFDIMLESDSMIPFTPSSAAPDVLSKKGSDDTTDAVQSSPSPAKKRWYWPF